MKKLEIKVTGDYKLYKKGTTYSLDGDLIVLSGINGSGKSQLLRIIAKNDKEPISRAIVQTENSGEAAPIENVLLVSFRDNIDLGKDFGPFSVTYRKNYATKAWEYYRNNIQYQDHMHIFNQKKMQGFKSGTLIYDDKGMKNPAWRSINRLVELLKCNFDESKIFNLTQSEIEAVLPEDFIWRSENDIVAQTGNLFYIACCNRVNKQIACSKTTEIFDNEAWLKNAPWTILNELFEDLRFKYRFKTDYTYATPYMEENPKLRINSDVRDLNDLSDGEKVLPFYKMKDNHKNDFWKDLFFVEREHFRDFEPLFTQVEKLFLKSK